MLTRSPPPVPSPPRSKLAPHMTNRWAQAQEVLDKYRVWANMGGSIPPKPVIVRFPRYGGGGYEEIIYSAQVGGWAGLASLHSCCYRWGIVCSLWKAQLCAALVSSASLPSTSLLPQGQKGCIAFCTLVPCLPGFNCLPTHY